MLLAAPLLMLIALETAWWIWPPTARQEGRLLQNLLWIALGILLALVYADATQASHFVECVAWDERTFECLQSGTLPGPDGRAVALDLIGIAVVVGSIIHLSSGPTRHVVSEALEARADIGGCGHICHERILASAGKPTQLENYRPYETHEFARVRATGSFVCRRCGVVREHMRLGSLWGRLARPVLGLAIVGLAVVFLGNLPSGYWYCPQPHHFDLVSPDDRPCSVLELWLGGNPQVPNQ
jgi:hypothetical protein